MAEETVELNPKESQADYFYQKGLSHSTRGEHQEAYSAYITSLKAYKSLVDAGREDLRKYLAGLYMNLGICLKDLEDLSNSQIAFAHCIFELEYLVKQGNNQFFPMLAKANGKFGKCSSKLEDWETAQHAYKLCINIYEFLVKNGKEELAEKLAEERMEQGICYSDAGNNKAALDCFAASVSDYERLINNTWHLPGTFFSVRFFRFFKLSEGWKIRLAAIFIVLCDSC